MIVGSMKKPESLPFFSLPPKYRVEASGMGALSSTAERTSDNLRALFFGIRHEVNDPLVLVLIDHWSQMCLIIQTITHHLFFRFFRELSQELIVNTLEHQFVEGQLSRHPYLLH